LNSSGQHSAQSFSDAREKQALSVLMHCFDAFSASLDDGVSDALTVAHAVVVACDRWIGAHQRAAFPNETDGMLAQLKERTRSRLAQQVASMVLHHRARRADRTSRPSAPRQAPPAPSAEPQPKPRQFSI
jgi:hypothetical protein